MYINDTAIERLCNINMREDYYSGYQHIWPDAANPYSGSDGLIAPDYLPIEGNAVELRLDSTFSFCSYIGNVVIRDKRMADIDATSNVTKLGGNRSNAVLPLSPDLSTDSIDIVEYYNSMVPRSNAATIDDLTIVVPPRSGFLCQSRERIQMPPSLLGFVYMRSSYARKWLDHATSQVIKPTFCGHITFEMQHTGVFPLEIDLASGVMQILFSHCELPKVPYFLESNSKYQGQQNQLSSLE